METLHDIDGATVGIGDDVYSMLTAKVYTVTDILYSSGTDAYVVRIHAPGEDLIARWCDRDWRRCPVTLTR